MDTPKVNFGSIDLKEEQWAATEEVRDKLSEMESPDGYKVDHSLLRGTRTHLLSINSALAAAAYQKQIRGEGAPRRLYFDSLVKPMLSNDRKHTSNPDGTFTYPEPKRKRGMPKRG